MGLLEDGENFLCDVFNENEDVEITYSVPPHDAPNTITGLLATVGETPTELDQDGFTLERGQLRDFIIRKSLLELNGEPVTPNADHRITETKDGVIYEYVLVDRIGQGVWRWHGATYKAVRVHTMLSGTS